MNLSEVMIAFMQPHERSSVEHFVNRAMQKQYGCDAYLLPELVLTARRYGDIIGTVAISEPATGLLPIQKFYDIEESSFPGSVHPGAGSMIQFGRWVAQEPSIARTLMREAVRYSLARHYLWAISEVKPQIVRRFRRMGVRLVILSGSVRLEHVPAAVLPYYHFPFPVLAMASLRELAVTL
jgi:hypothetical protein